MENRGGYTTLKDQAQGIALELSSRKIVLEASYNQVVPLMQKLLEIRASQVSLRVEITAIRKEAKRFHTKFEALKNSPKEFK